MLEFNALLKEVSSDNNQLSGDTEPQINQAEELRQKWGVEPGQLWQLGEHRLICGDCTDAAVVARVMAGILSADSLPIRRMDGGFGGIVRRQPGISTNFTRTAQTPTYLDFAGDNRISVVGSPGVIYGCRSGCDLAVRVECWRKFWRQLPALTKQCSLLVGYFGVAVWDKTEAASAIRAIRHKLSL